MNHIKQSFFKRVLAIMLCTVVLSSTVFFSYENTIVVKAIEKSDLYEDAVYIALAAAGILFSGGTITPVMLLPFIETIVGAGFDVHEYVTQDEETGTTTISEEFVNLVLQAYKDYKEENADKFDGTMIPNEYGYYHYDSLSCVTYFSPTSSSGHTSKIYTDINTYYPMAIVVYSNQKDYNNGNGKICYAHAVLYNKDDDKFYSRSISKTTIAYGEDVYLTDFEQTIDGYGFLEKVHFVFRNMSTGETATGEEYISMAGPTGALPPTASITVNSSSVPIYYSLSSLKEGLRSGDFSAAWNYGKVPECESPSYTGEYNGGDITVDTELLEGIRDKIEELEGTNKSIEELLKELLEWLKLNPGSGTGGGGGSVDVTVNVDLTETNNWLYKIYNKLSEIYAKMNDALEDAGNTAIDKIQESLDEIISQLKQIKGWTIADTVIDGIDAVADWADFIKDLFDDSDSGVYAISSTMDGAANLLKTKFPFCIPWDVYFLVSFLAHEPETPVFHLPLKLERLGIDESIEVDMSQFQVVSDISRTLLTLIYCYALLNLTIKIFPMTKEET